GSGLIHPEFCQTARTVNCHPGLILQSRGLDGRFTTTCQSATRCTSSITKSTSAKCSITRSLTFSQKTTWRVLRNDTTWRKSFLLSHFDSYLQDGMILDFIIGDPRKRMPRQTEALLVHDFDVYKERHTRDLKDRRVGRQLLAPRRVREA